MSRLDHVALSVSDIDDSAAWYDRFGFTEQHPRWEAEDGSLTIAQLKSEGGGIELFSQPDLTLVPVPDANAGDLSTSGLKHFCILTTDLDGDLRRLAEEDVHPVTEVRDARSIPGARYVFFRDPDGNWVELMERPA